MSNEENTQACVAREDSALIPLHLPPHLYQVLLGAWQGVLCRGCLLFGHWLLAHWSLLHWLVCDSHVDLQKLLFVHQHHF